MFKKESFTQKLFFILLIILTAPMGWADELDPIDDFPMIDPDDPLVRPFPIPPMDLVMSLSVALPRLVASGGNYHSYLPTGNVDFEIENKGSLDSWFWVLSLKPDGDREIRQLKVDAGKTLLVAGQVDNENDEVYLLAMQNFAITTLQPVKSVGPPSRNIQVTPAQSPLTYLRTIEDHRGTPVTVAIDYENNVHFPVYGRLIGQWDTQSQHLVLENGTFLRPSRER